MNSKTIKQAESLPQPEPKPSDVVRTETYRRPYNPREWETGRPRRTTFTGVWTRDGRYHDVD